MKHHYLNILFLVIICSCHNSNVPEDMVSSARKDFKKQAEEFNKNEIDQIKLTDSFYKLAKCNLDTAINAVNQFILTNPRSSEFYYIKGDIYYRYKKYTNAKDEYSKAINIDFVPKYLNSRAKCFINLKELDNCLSDLKSSTKINHAGNWLIGNFYEIKRNIDSAKYFYKILFTEDRVVYKYCQDRISYLGSKNPSLLDQIIITDTSNLRIFFDSID